MDVYEKLREILDAHPSGAPKSKAFDEILRILFTHEEAELAIYMSFSPKPVQMKVLKEKDKLERFLKITKR
jgi:hypothetical protein